MYPLVKEGVSFEEWRERGSSSVQYRIKNENGDEYEVSRALYKALLRADGTKPVRSLSQNSDLLRTLVEYGLIQISRFERGSHRINRFILFPVGRKAGKHRNVFKTINRALPFVSVITFMMGVAGMLLNSIEICFDYYGWMYYLLFVISVFGHEAGHLVAALSYGYRVRDIGILLYTVFPIGAYLQYFERSGAGRRERIQFYLSGIEVNLFLAGLFLLITRLYYPFSFTAVNVGNINIFLAIVNLLPIPGTDGEKVLSVHCGIDSISAETNRWIFSGKNHKKRHGYGRICAYIVTAMSEVLVLLMIGYEVIYFVMSLVGYYW